MSPSEFCLMVKGQQLHVQCILLYSGTSDNRLPLLRKPPQCRQEDAVPNHSLLFNVHSNLRIAETSLLWITDTKVRSQQTKSTQISIWKWTVLTYWWKRVGKYLLFSPYLSILQCLSALKEREGFEYVAYGNWKGSSHYQVHSLYRGHLPIADTSAYVVPQCIGSNLN